MERKKYIITEAARELGITRAAVHAAISQKRLKAKPGNIRSRKNRQDENQKVG